MTLGDELRSARKKLGKTQYEIAVEAGLRPEVVSRLETGKSRASLLSLHKLCPILGLSLDTLTAAHKLDGSPAPLPPSPAKKKKGTKP